MKRFITRSNLRLFFEVSLIGAVLVISFSGPIASKAAESLQPAAPNAVYWYVCNPPNHVAVFTDRVHILCTTTTPVAGAPALNPAILWFAFPTSPDFAAASRFLSLFQTSVITAKPIWVELDPADTSGNSFGCGGSNCRRIFGVEMR